MSTDGERVEDSDRSAVNCDESEFRQHLSFELQDAELVFADAQLLVQWVSDVAPHVEVRTFSPGVNTTKAYDGLTSERMRKLEIGAAEVADGLRDLIWDEDPDLASAIARVSQDSLHRLLYKAACLIERDFQISTVLLQPSDCSDPIFNDTFSSPLEELFNGHKKFRCIYVPRQLLSAVDDPRPPAPKLLTRLAFGNPLAKIFRLFQMFWSLTSLQGPRGTILTVRDNELVKETGSWLAMRGYALATLPVPQPVCKSVRGIHAQDIELVKRLRGALPELCKRAFSGVLSDSAITALGRSFGQRVTEAAADYRKSRELWRLFLADACKRGHLPRAVLTNTIGGISIAALHHILRNRGIPLVVFQHGVTMEYHATHHHYGAAHETACSDLAVLYNQRGVAAATRSKYRQGKGVAVGVPRDYVAGKNIGYLKNAPPIWYIATALYLGNRGTLFEGVADGDKSAFEYDVVDRVLSRLPYRVAYKAYPGRRFLDPLPEELEVERTENINMIHQRIDMRYLFGAARVLITARSFSTPSWCIMSGKPVIHIDIPAQSPLTPEAKEAFADSVFLFDAGSTDFHEELREFLSKPLPEIEDLYASKAPAREYLKQQFISAHGARGAGFRAASEIERFIKTYTPNALIN